MIPTIYSFTRALLSPAEWLATLCDAHAATDNTGRPHIVRTTRFVEAQIEWQDAQWLLCMPQTSAAIPNIERMAARLKSLHSEWLVEYRLLRAEMRYEDSTGATHHSDLVLQQLPPGHTFPQALAMESTETLLSALDALQAELSRLGLSHHNLKGENLRWCNGRLVPIRYHHLHPAPGGDEEAFDALRDGILRSTNPQQTANDATAPYGTSQMRLPGHLQVGNTFEQLICIEDEAGWGYVDPENRVVIPAQFLWADDFHEGRAPVETASGMGLIDKQGHYIIPADYQIVEYDPQSGLSRVKREGLWACFDYEGRRLTDLTTQECIDLKIKELGN